MTIEFGSSHFDVLYAKQNGNIKIACTRGLETYLDQVFRIGKEYIIGNDF
jgi:hypothetical protein